MELHGCRVVTVCTCAQAVYRRHVESFFFFIPAAADVRSSMLLCAHFDESIYLLARQSEGQTKAELWQNVAQVACVTRAAAFFFF